MGSQPHLDVILLNVSSIHLTKNRTAHMLPTTEKATMAPTPKTKFIRVNSQLSARMDRAQKGISTNVFHTSYDPMTGVRTGCILGGFLLLIIAYTAYKGRCKDRDDIIVPTPEELCEAEYKQKYDEYKQKVDERAAQKEDEKNFRKSMRKQNTTLAVEQAPKQEFKSAALEKTKKWLQDQPFDLEKLECTECKIHGKVNQFQVVPSHSLSFEDLHQCSSDRDDDFDQNRPTKGGYLAINDITLLRKRPSDLEAIDFSSFMSRDYEPDEHETLVSLHSDPQAADDETTTIDIQVTDLSHDADYMSFSSDNELVTPSIVTPSVTSQQDDLTDAEHDDSIPLLHKIHSPARYISKESVQKLRSDEQLSLLDSVHIIPEYPDKPRYSDGVLEFGRLFKPGQDAVPQPRKLLDIRDNSKFSLYKSSPDSITCDPLTLTFPALPFDDSFTSSSGDHPESPSSSEKPASVLSASSVTIYVTPMSSPNYESSQHSTNQGVILQIDPNADCT